jgi:hypothetical protein
MLTISSRAARVSLITCVALFLPQAAVSIPFNSATFSHPLQIDNKYFPLVRGTTQYTRARIQGEGCETDVSRVTSDTRQILGVTTRVVHDVVFSDPKCNGSLIKQEDTLDYYAQDDAGNVWYVGEISKDCDDDGDSCTRNEGSWIGGEDIFNIGTKAKPGVIMLAHPSAHVGDTYRQEYYPGHAEDTAQIVAIDVPVKLTLANALPPKTFRDCIKTKEKTALEPGVTAFKYFCPQVGFVLGTESPPASREERIQPPAANPVSDAFRFRTVPG